MTVPRNYERFQPLFDELCRVLAEERGNGRGVHDDVYALLRRHDGGGVGSNLVGIKPGGEWAVWEWRLDDRQVSRQRFSRELSSGERAIELLDVPVEEVGGLAWVHPDYRTAFRNTDGF